MSGALCSQRVGGSVAPESLWELEVCWADSLSARLEVTESTSGVNRHALRCVCVSGSWDPTSSPPWFRETAKWEAGRPVSCGRKRTHAHTQKQRHRGGEMRRGSVIERWSCRWRASDSLLMADSGGLLLTGAAAVITLQQPQPAQTRSRALIIHRPYAQTHTNNNMTLLIGHVLIVITRRAIGLQFRTVSRTNT